VVHLSKIKSQKQFPTINIVPTINPIEKQLWHQHIILCPLFGPRKTTKLANVRSQAGQQNRIGGVKWGGLHKYMNVCMPWYNELIIPKANTQIGADNGGGAVICQWHTYANTRTSIYAKP